MNNYYNFKLNINNCNNYYNYIPQWYKTYNRNVDMTSTLKITNKSYYTSRDCIKSYSNVRGRKGSI